jgi:hypothetical protein
MTGKVQIDMSMGSIVAEMSRIAMAPNLVRDPLRKQAETLAADVDQIRTNIVATKEGGMITGEERLREYLGGLYGDVTQYDGRPTDSQIARAAGLAHDLDDVVSEFNKSC